MAQSRLHYPEEEFTWRLRARMPMNVGFTFTQDQLQALRTAFGHRFQKRHAVDLRGRIRLPRTRYYVVFQCGRDRRTDLRRSPSAHRWLDGAIYGAALCSLFAGLAWVFAGGF
jgi:hypothetical protein